MRCALGTLARKSRSSASASPGSTAINSPPDVCGSNSASRTLSGKFLEVNKNLVTDLKRLGIWEDVKDDLLINQGDIQNIDAIPDELKAVYKTSFQLSPYSFIEVAARAQKWVDQAISRNMYLETRDIDEYVKIYTEAWKRGLKTTYYLHVKPRHQSEQTTVNSNDKKVRVETGGRKVGFGFAKAKK